MDSIRSFRPEDAEACARLFYETVRRAAGPAYGDREREAWAPEVPDTRDWCQRLAAAETWVAEDREGVSGFMSLTPQGLVDLAYVRADRIGSGVAHQLHGALLQAARAAGLEKLETDASDLARVFFERQGWHVVRVQRPVRMGVALTNYRMERSL